jgi:hypothetical protein
MQIVLSLLLAVFALLSLIDGVYLHLVKYRLHSRPESWREHVFHTIRAILFLPIVLALMAVPSAGLLLWTGVLFVLVDQAVELLDMMSEKDSRAGIGGLSSFEYVLHVVLTTVRASAIVLSLAMRPAEAWLLDAPNVMGAHGAWLTLLVRQLVPGAVVVALVHLWLAVRYRPREVAA